MDKVSSLLKDRAQAVLQPITQGWKNRKENFWWAWILTICYGGIFLFVRGGDTWNVLTNRDLNELGDFLSGVFTPLAFLWLIIGYRLQYQEFRLQRKEVQLQREELHATAATLGSQTDLLSEQTTAERLRSIPRFDFEEDESAALGERKFELLNFGGPARNLKMSLEELLEEPQEGIKGLVPLHRYRRHQLGAGESYDFSLPDPDPGSEREYRYTTLCFSERHERFFQRWRMHISGGKGPFSCSIDEITDGPTLEEAYRKISTEDYRVHREGGA